MLIYLHHRSRLRAKGSGRSFKQHVCDVAGIIHLLCSHTFGTISLNDISFWLVVQCRPKINERFRVRAKNWSTPPWEVMENWKGPEADDNIPSVQIRVPQEARPHLPSRLPFDGNNIPLNRETVQMWINGLGFALSKASKLCKENDKLSLQELDTWLMSAWWIMGQSEIRDVIRDTQSLLRDFNGAV